MNQPTHLLSRIARISLLLVVILTSCKKDPYQVGLDLLPPSDTLYVSRIDTLSVVAYSIVEDSVRTDELTAILLGSVVDPVFGTTTTSFFSQFLLSSETIDFGVSPVLDSLVMELHYASWYGDTTTLQQVKVFEMSDDIYADSTYYSNQTVGSYGIELASLVYQPRPTDSVSVLGVNQAPHLRINLSNRTHYLGNKILFAPPDVLASNAQFIRFMKGLHVRAGQVSSKGALISYAPGSGFSKLVIYFHNETGDSLSFDMPMDATAARFNQYDHHGYENAGPEFKQQVLYGDTSLGKNLLYLQTLGGVKVRIRFPFIRALRDSLGPIAINSAVLTLTNPESDDEWQPPASLALYKVDSTGKIGSLLDASEGSAYFGGAYNSDSRQYWFRLTRHFQQLLINDTLQNYDLLLYAADPLVKAPAANRVILNGTNPLFTMDAANRLRLQIIYTQLD